MPQPIHDLDFLFGSSFGFWDDTPDEFGGVQFAGLAIPDFAHHSVRAFAEFVQHVVTPGKGIVRVFYTNSAAVRQRVSVVW